MGVLCALALSSAPSSGVCVPSCPAQPSLFASATLSSLPAVTSLPWCGLRQESMGQMGRMSLWADVRRRDPLWPLGSHLTPDPVWFKSKPIGEEEEANSLASTSSLQILRAPACFKAHCCHEKDRVISLCLGRLRCRETQQLACGCEGCEKQRRVYSRAWKSPACHSIVSVASAGDLKGFPPPSFL